MMNDDFDFGDYVPLDNKEFRVRFGNTWYSMVEDKDNNEWVSVDLVDDEGNQIWLDSVYQVSDDFFENMASTQSLVERLIKESFNRKMGY